MSAYHVAPLDLRGWVEGHAEAVAAMSVEQHLVRCEQCRASVATLIASGPAAGPDLDAVWMAVRDEVELPPRSWLEGVLTRLGLPPADAILVSAAPALRGSWLCAVALALLFAVGGAMSIRQGGVTLFLTFAPLAPVLGVALAFGPEASPALEQESAAPYPLVRLVLLRTCTVLLTALPVVLLGQAVLPERVSLLWLLPAAGFTAAVLALSTWFGPWRPALTITLVWVACTSTAALRWHDVEVLLNGRYLVLYVLMLVLGPVVLVLRARRFGTVGRIS